MEIITRRPGIEETPALRQIWRTVFGGSDDGIFFSYYYEHSICITAGREDSPVSAGYFIPAGNVSCGKLTVPCAMIYAVATMPEHRNRGYGSAVVRALISAARDAGFPAVVLCPSGDDLFGYYSANTELREWFYTSEQRIAAPRQNAGCARLSRISAEEYRTLRNTLLAGKPHIGSDRRAVEYQDLLCREFGGGLYRADSPDGVSCAVVERAPDGVIFVKELLTPSAGENGIISAVSAAYPAPGYIVRSPVRSRTAACKRFGMLAIPEEFNEIFKKERNIPWYGLAFD